MFFNRDRAVKGRCIKIHLRPCWLFLATQPIHMSGVVVAPNVDRGILIVVAVLNGLKLVAQGTFKIAVIHRFHLIGDVFS